MHVDEHQAATVGVALPTGHQISPAIADIDAEGVEAPEEGGQVGQVDRQRAQRIQDRPIVQRQRRVILAKFDVEQRFVPPDMHLGQVVRRRPQLLARGHPAQTVFRTAGHLHDVRDGVVRPEAVRFEFGARRDSSSARA